MQIKAKFDIPNIKEMLPEMSEEISRQTDIKIDCSALQYFTTAGAQVLESMLKTLDETGRKMALVNSPDWLAGDFDLLGLKETFQRITPYE